MRKEAINIIGEFSLSTLEGIQKTGKYVIRGFRVGGPKSEIKKQRFTVELAKEKNIIETIKKYAIEQVEKGYLDNTWTFIDEIDTKNLNHRLKTFEREKVLLELISNDRMDVIKEFFDFNQSSEKENFKEDDNEEQIVKLREKIIELEKNKNNREKIILKFQKTIEQNKNEFIKRDKKEKLLKEELKDEVDKREINENNIRTIEKEINSVNSEVKELQKENLKLKQSNKQMKIYIIGGEKIKTWFKQNNSLNKYFFIFCDLRIEEIKASEKVNEIWLITPYIDTNYMRLINNNLFISKMNKLQRKFRFNDLDEVKIHMSYQEVIN